MRRKLLYFIFSASLLLTPLFSGITPAYAAENCSILNKPTLTTASTVIDGITFQVPDQFDLGPSAQYYVYIDSVGGENYPTRIDATINKNVENKTISINDSFDKDGTIQATDPRPFAAGPVYFMITTRDYGKYAGDEPINTFKNKSICNTNENMIIDVVSSPIENPTLCTISFPGSSLIPSEIVNMKVEFTDENFRGLNTQRFDVKITWPGNSRNFINDERPTAERLESGFPIGSYGGGINYKVSVERGFGTIGDEKSCSQTFTIDASGGNVGCIRDEQCDDGQICVAGGDGIIKCQNPGGPNQVPKVCEKDGDNYVCKTALGGFSSDPDSFATSVLTLLLSLAGTILIVLLIVNGYKLMVSQGEPEKIKDAREGIVAAIAGLLMIIFSLSILRLITVDILGIPGFS